MNSLARVKERNETFEDITEPLPDSVFHSPRELLWKVKHYLDKSVQDPNERANWRRELYDYLRVQLDIRRTGYEEKAIKHSGYLYPAPDSSVDERELSFSTAWDGLAHAIFVAADRLWRDVFLNDPTNKAAKDQFHSAKGDKGADKEIRRL